MKHDDLVRWAVDYLNRLPGSYAYETHATQRNKPKTPGIADVGNVRGGLAYYYEVKIGDDTLRPDQNDFRDRVIAAFGRYTVIRSPEDLVRSVFGEKHA
jgi:hypothetical protein